MVSLRHCVVLCFLGFAGASPPGCAAGACSSGTSGPLMLQARHGRVQKLHAQEGAPIMGLWTDSPDAVTGASCEYANAATGGLQSPAAQGKYMATRTYCLANPDVYASGDACGACWRVSREGHGSLVVQIVGSHGGTNSLDCHRDAFEAIAGQAYGSYEVDLEPVDCDLEGGGPRATVMDGNNAWYTRVIFSNLPRAVLGARISLGGDMVEMQRVSGATWSAQLGGKEGATASFAVTLEGGEVMNFPCFDSWPVAGGSSCTGAMPAPQPQPQPAPAPLPVSTTSTTSATTPATTTSATTASTSEKPTTSLAPPGTCAAPEKDCRDFGCCQTPGQTCFEKDAFWASCRASCEPGSTNPRDPEEFRTPWTCQVLGVGGPSPAPTPRPSPSPSPAPQPLPGPKGSFSTSAVGSSKDRLFEFVSVLTNQPVSGSKARAVQSSGGAAGGVVSESQGYGLLLGGTILASMEDDADFDRVAELTYEVFLGWRRMCELSAASGSCQDDEGFQCGGGRYPCLPHWKFGEDLTAVVGRGAAPDGDVDALAGMLLAVLALEETSREPAWMDEVGQWAYDTCKQFYLSSTVPSQSGDHQIVKLGSCWGGWGTQGQNPSYHAPGIYRLCRDYMKSHDGRYGSSAAEGESWEANWEALVATTYKMLEATQCDSTGLVPNWAQVFEEGARLRAQTGFSGSGTPGAEFGAEASRTIWRVVVDFLLFPDEAAKAAAFLAPVAKHLAKKESGGRWANSLDIDGSCLVDSIHASWNVNMFMAAPTFSSLVCPSGLPAGRQQELIDSAGELLATKRIRDYYSGSWIAISTMTMNGDLARAASKVGLGHSQSLRQLTH
mmetsp:Transcript_10102/g.18819  ORF Transcript_10102/g.18819 Transcript_10102/m.18819 type:complete len:837 (-) Transcript_10102:267-2777(-)